MWSKHERCDSTTYPPVVMGMSAVIWATMFYLCSMTDRNHKRLIKQTQWNTFVLYYAINTTLPLFIYSSTHSLIPNPWRIVLPAFVYFAFMSILSIYYTCRSQKALNAACQSLSNAFDVNGDVPMCGALLDQFAGTGHVNPSVLYYAYLVCIYAVMFLWIFLSTLMLLRCVFGVDFQKTGMEIKPISCGVSESMAPTPLAQHKGFAMDKKEQLMEDI